MIRMLLKEIAEAIGSSAPASEAKIPVRGVSIDSREMKPGDLFIAVQGARFDGHDFIGQAAIKGAGAFVCRRDKVGQLPGDVVIPRLVVDDTIEALGRLATYYRREVMPAYTTVVAVTGSNGKTTTKRMIDHVLGQSMKGRSSPRSFNNNIGVPLTILSGEADDRYMIAEIGTNAPGEVAALSAMVAPDIAVITSVGQAHLEGLSDLAGVAAEKASLLDHLRPEGLAVVDADSPELEPLLEKAGGIRMVTFGTSQYAALRLTSVRGTMDRTTFELDGRYHMVLPMPGVCHATNAAAAFAVALEFGVGVDEIAKRLKGFTPPDGRTRVLTMGQMKVINDTYNANPSSMLAAVNTLRQASGRRRVFIMGDMLELGAASPGLHRDVVGAICRAGIEVLVAVGPQTTEAVHSVAETPGGVRFVCCDDVDAAGKVLPTILLPGDTVWIKASRAMQLDQLVDDLRIKLGKNAAVA
ncbi:MAG: UDP-N-acetylmuramoyl-tripeptide--D-alanyl-D-alanine ligase [Phycisphaerales bacterium]|nr:MAG: UDP-N-acetylmuramoyl-tripeptide--D-alanyl-D-alanine ligase [Phycisphaerales bacterium]